MLHIARQKDWDRARESGVYALADGVIHGCSSSQLAMVAAAHFPAHDGFVVLSVDESRAAGEVRVVTYRDGERSDSFPHLHGSFPVSAVLSVRTLASALQELEQAGR